MSDLFAAVVVLAAAWGAVSGVWWLLAAWGEAVEAIWPDDDYYRGTRL